MAEHKQRKTYVVKRAFQLKYAGIIIFFILLTVFLAGVTTYLSLFPYLSAKLANVYPQSRLVLVLASANSRLLYVAVILMPLAVWIAMGLSHKIAGPWLRMENILLDMAQGNIKEDVKLRKGDELQSLAEALNKVTARLRENKTKIAQELDALEQDLAKLQEALSGEAPDLAATKQLISKLSQTNKNLKSIIV